jgi:hypothetical protein
MLGKGGCFVKCIKTRLWLRNKSSSLRPVISEKYKDSLVVFQTSHMLPEDEDTVSNDVPGSVNKKMKFRF